MRLENLYPNFGKSSLEEQANYIATYRLRRAEDMGKQPTWPKPKKVSKSKAKALPLTEAEKSIMSLMGLKKKDVLAMREMREMIEN